MKKNPKVSLSPNSLNLLQDCDRCFWLTLHGIWERPKAPFPSLPSGMDGILKIHFDKFMKRNLLPPELLREKECKNLRLFSDEKKLFEWRDARKGIFYVNEEGYKLFGAVDNILVEDDEMIILDYKTRGFATKNNTADYYSLQMEIYTLLLKKNGYKTKDFAYLLFYYPTEVRETGEIVFETELKKVKLELENAEKVFRKGILVFEGECPKKPCVWCQHFRFS